MSQLKPEVIKPGLHVMVNWLHHKGGKLYYPGEVKRKLRKNWLVEVSPRGSFETQMVSVPYEALKINPSFTKEGRPLMATKEDTKIFWGKDHIDYCQSLSQEEGKLQKIYNEHKRKGWA